MEKTELMKKYETETGKQSAIVKFMAGGQAMEIRSYPRLGVFDYSVDYISWLESKAAAYDRLMSGGKKTPMEWADLFGMYFGVDLNGWGGLYLRKPHKSVSCWEAFAWDDLIARIPPNLIQWTGIWQDSLCKPKSITNSSDSLTLPDGWEESDAR